MPRVEAGYLYTDDVGCIVGSTAWYAWLELNRAFYYVSLDGIFSAYKEQRKGQTYWYAYRRMGRKLYNSYLGRSEELTIDRLAEIARQLTWKIER